MHKMEETHFNFVSNKKYNKIKIFIETYIYHEVYI